MRSNLFASLKFILVVNTLILCPLSTAGVISYSGIEVEGSINSVTGVNTLSQFEKGLFIESLLESVEHGSYSGNKYKLEKNYTNITMETYRNGFGEDVPILIDGDYQSKTSLSFENSDAADSFTEKLANSNFSSELTNAMLHRPIAVNHVANVVGLTVEPVAEQIRTTDSNFSNSLFNDNGHGRFAVDYSFSAIVNNVNSFDYMHLLVSKSVKDYFTSFDHSLYGLNVFEQDFNFSTVESLLDTTAIETSYSQRFWFDDEDSAISALNYFEQDIDNVTERTFRSPLLSGFELEQSSLSFIQNTTEVPEPTTLVIFFSGILGIFLHRQKKEMFNK